MTESAISVVRAAARFRISRQVGNVVEVKTSLRIPIIEVVRSEKAMSLRAHIPDLNFHVVREFALDREIVLRGILAAHVWLKLSEEQNRTEGRPIDRLAAWRVQDSVEWIRVEKVPLWSSNGVLNKVPTGKVLPPNGGSALNCSRTSCSIGL